MNKYTVNSHSLKVISFFFCFILVFLLTLSGTSGLPDSESTEQTALAVDEVIISKGRAFPIVVIDPGHGGRDGGASSASGTLEKDINLQLGKLLERISTAYGLECIMTRQSDEMLGSELPGNKKKMKDLKSRVNTANSVGDCVFISIHQNKFPQKKYKGLQVYYSRNSSDSKPLAQGMQQNVRQYVQPDNDRVIKQASSNIYVLDNVRCPAVLIECGFLSNDEEARLLCDRDYQKKLTAAVFSALFNYLQEYPK